MPANSPTTALVLWRALVEPEEETRETPVPVGMLSLFSALRRLTYRGSGPAAWAAPLGEDPIAFLLDSASDGILVWSPSGRLLYANQAAEKLHLREPAAAGITRIRVGHRELERRSLRFALSTTIYVVEIVRARRAPAVAEAR
jgi:PAS domain-containing protein